MRIDVGRIERRRNGSCTVESGSLLRHSMDWLLRHSIQGLNLIGNGRVLAALNRLAESNRHKKEIQQAMDGYLIDNGLYSTSHLSHSAKRSETNGLNAKRPWTH